MKRIAGQVAAVLVALFVVAAVGRELWFATGFTDVAWIRFLLFSAAVLALFYWSKGVTVTVGQGPKSPAEAMSELNSLLGSTPKRFVLPSEPSDAPMPAVKPTLGPRPSAVSSNPKE